MISLRSSFLLSIENILFVDNPLAPPFESSRSEEIGFVKEEETYAVDLLYGGYSVEVLVFYP